MAKTVKSTEESRLRAAMRRRLLVVRLSLVLERLWRALWPAAILLAFYAGAALFGIPEALPAALHGTVLVAILLFAAILAWRRRHHVRWPREDEVRRRLEAENGASHRPLDAMFDHAAMAAGGVSLWRRHRRLMAARARALRPGPPRLSLSAEDPRALRALAALLLLVGLLHAGGDSGRRLLAGFVPAFADRGAAVRLDAWIAPPDYSGGSPIVLSTAGDGPSDAPQGQTIAVPQGAQLMARLHGGGKVPRMVLGATEHRFSRAGTADYRLTAPIDASGTLEIRQGRQRRAAWPVTIIADQPPVIGFSRPPRETRRHALRIDYTLFDDYGVADASLELTPREVAGAPLTIDLRGAETAGEPVELTAYKDLTAHPYAGAEVAAVLRAHDALGQEAASAPVVFRLPERVFTHPVAKALVAVRKDLLRAPDRRDRAAERLDTISRDVDAYDGDLKVFAALRSSFWRLIEDDDAAAIDDVTAMLWDTALRLEDGQVSLAARSLRDALEAFEEALSGGPEDVAAAAEALARMMQNFLAQLGREQDELAPQMAQSRAGEMTVVGADLLQDMIRQMRALAAAGETEAARRLLAQLREIMENASTGTLSAEDYRRMMAASRARQALDKLEQAQRDLLNDTSRQALFNRLLSRRGSPPRDFSSLGDTQQALGQALSDVRRDLGDSGVKAPPSLAEAQTAMEGASGALAKNAGPAAIRQQAEAVQALSEAARALDEMVSQAMASMPGMGAMDPLGRPRPGLSTRDYLLPDKAGMRAARRILEELRKRISDPNLSDEERSYLRRLLRRF